MAVTETAPEEPVDETALNNSRDLYFFGMSRLNAGDVDGALRAHRRAVAIDDDKHYTAYASINLAAHLTERCEFEEALSFSWRATTLDPDNVQFVQIHARLLRVTGRTDEAIRYYRSVIEAAPEHSQHFWTDIALMLTARARYLEALDIVRGHAAQYVDNTLQHKTMLEVSDICLAAYEHPEAPISSTFGCPTPSQASAQWHALFADCAAFRRHAPIICVGDSHAAFFSGAHCFQYSWPEPSPQLLPHVSGAYIASALAYSLNRRNTTERGLEKLESFLRSNTLVKGASLMLSFGEIDLRNHVLAQARDQGRSIEAVVADCVTAYRTAVELVLASGFRTLIWAPPPSRADEGPYPFMFPTTGSEAERNAATRCFIDALRAAMRPLGVPVISIFDAMIDGDLRSDPRYFMDSCHLNMAATPLAIAAMRRGLETIDD